MAMLSPSGVRAIAAGTNTEISQIIAPTSADAGALVNVEVRVRNIHAQTLAAIAVVRYNEFDLPQPDYQWIDPGATQSFFFSFTMPGMNTKVHVWTAYATETEWIIDDYGSIDIALTGAPQAEFSRVRYWDTSIGQYVSEPPTVPIGSIVGADFIVENISGQSLDIGLFVEAFDPFGNSIGVKLMGPGLLAPGSSFGGWHKITTEYPGTYRFTVDIITSPLVPYGIIGTLGNIPIAHVVGEIPPLSGFLHSPFVFDTTSGGVYYSAELPVVLDGGIKLLLESAGRMTAVKQEPLRPHLSLLTPTAYQGRLKHLPPCFPLPKAPADKQGSLLSWTRWERGRYTPL